jgi:5-methylcytosine-specific restriction endonuclease McrA
MLSQHDATLDHIKPRHVGGLTERKNLAACCFSCNSHKSGRNWKEWFKEQSFYSENREKWIHEWQDQ